MILQEVNTVALATAAELVVGAEAAQRIATVYTYIDRVMKTAYDLGQQDGQDNASNKADVAFDEGYEQGARRAQVEAYADIEAKLDEASDEAYVAGVDHARRRPDLADEIVAEIVAGLDEHAINSVDVEDGEGKHNASPEGASWIEYFTGDEPRYFRS